MSQFEYLSVLTSIIIGLAIANLLSGAARLIQMRARMRPHGATYLWMAALFLINIQVWWAAFDRRGSEEWNFFGFLLYLLIPIILFLLSYLILPDFSDDGAPDLPANFDGNRAWFFGLLAVLPVVSMIEDAVRDGHMEPDADLAFKGFFLLLALAATRIRNPRIHLWFAMLVLLIILVYITTLFLQLR